MLLIVRDLQDVQLPADYNEDFGYMLIELDNDLTLVPQFDVGRVRARELVGRRSERETSRWEYFPAVAIRHPQRLADSTYCPVA